MGKCLTFFLLLVVLNAIICLFFLRSQRLLQLTSNAADLKDEQFQRKVFTGNRNNLNGTKHSNTEPTLSGSAYSLDYIINPSDLCETVSGQSHKLAFLVLVHSAVHNVEERRTIRATWGSPATLRGNRGSVVRIAFLLGSTSNETLQTAIADEASLYSDIIQGDFADSYQNLTLKSILMLKWASDHCTDKAYFLLKTDDDMYVNLPNLLKIVTKLPAARNAMYGILFRKAVPDRNPRAKWYVPKTQFPGKVFPDYLSGTAYFMTFDAISKLYTTCLKKTFLGMEDIFVTGICASAVGVKRFQVKGFSHLKRPSTGCAFRDAVTGHHVTVSQMRHIFKELSNKSKMLKCGTTGPQKVRKPK